MNIRELLRIIRYISVVLSALENAQNALEKERNLRAEGRELLWRLEVCASQFFAWEAISDAFLMALAEWGEEEVSALSALREVIDCASEVQAEKLSPKARIALARLRGLKDPRLIFGPDDQLSEAKAASLLKAVGTNIMRQRILDILVHQEGDAGVTELAEDLGCSQTDLSRYLSDLRDKGIVDCADGGDNAKYYFLRREAILSLLEVLENLLFPLDLEEH